MNNIEKVRGLLEQASNSIAEAFSAIEEMTPASASVPSTPLSQKDYVPVVARVLANQKNGRGEMHYRDIADLIISQKLIELGDKDFALIKLGSNELGPRVIQRVRDAMADTQLGKQIFERGSKRGYYKLSPLGRQICGQGEL